MERRPLCQGASVVALFALSIWPCSAFGQSTLLVSDDAYSIIWTVDIDTAQTLRGFSVPEQAIGNSVPPGRSGLAFDGTDLFYTHSSSRTIWALDPVSGAVRRTLAKPAIDIAGLGAGGGALYALTSSARPGTLYKMDPVTGAILESTEQLGGRDALDFSAARNSLFLRVGELELREIRVTTKETLVSFPPPAGLTGLALDDSTGSLFGVSANNIVYRMNRISGAVLDSFELRDTAGNSLVRCGGLAIASAGLPGGGGGAGLQAAGGGAATAPEPVLKAQATTIVAGETGDVLIRLSSTEEVQGFQVALLHEPAVIWLESITLDGTATSANEADFNATETLANGGTLGVVFDLLQPFLNNTLPAGGDQVVAKYTYGCVDLSIETAALTEVRFLDGVLGTPVKENAVLIDGAELAAEVYPGRITCLPRIESEDGPHFFCGGPLDASNLPSPLTSTSGDGVEVCFYYTFPDPGTLKIQGVSMSIAYDCRMTCLENTFNVPPDSVTAVVDADFVSFQCDNDPDDGDGCEMVLGLLVDVFPPFGESFLPGTQIPLKLACVTLVVEPTVPEGECLDILFVDGLGGNGNVPIKNLVSLENFSISPTTHPCEVCVMRAGPAFYCGSDTLGANGLPELLTGVPGDEVQICFWYSSPLEPVLALTQSLRFDCRLDCLQGTFQLAPNVPNLDQADFISFTCNNDPAGPGPCEMLLQIVGFSTQTQTGIILPLTEEPLKLGGVEVRITDDTLGRCLALEYQNSVTASNSMELNSGLVAPDTFDCRVCVGPLPKFFCGGPLGPDGQPTRLEDVERGEQVELCFWYCSPSTELDALSMALCFDCNLSCIEPSFHIPFDSILNTLPPDFINFQCDNDPNDGDGCEMLLGLLVDLEPPIDRFLPATESILKVASVNMEVGPLAKPGFCLPINFCDGINGNGRVPIKNIASIHGTAFTPDTFDCDICTPFLGPKFLCGDGKLGPDGLPLPPIGKPGEPVKLFFWYCSPDDFSVGHVQLDHLQGLSMALTFDCRLTCIEDSIRLPPDSITAALDAEYVSFQCDNDPSDGDGCEMILAILIDASPPFDGRTLPPTQVPLKLACVDLIGPDIPDCSTRCFPVRFKDGINGRGNIPTANLISTENMSFLAGTTDCEVCIETIPGSVFRRGDCNHDGEIDVADAAETIAFLIGVGTWKSLPPCLDACDANDDGRIDLVDASFLLVYLFLNGFEPPPPGPFELGLDPTEDKVGCDLEPCPEE